MKCRGAIFEKTTSEAASASNITGGWAVTSCDGQPYRLEGARRQGRLGRGNTLIQIPLQTGFVAQPDLPTDDRAVTWAGGDEQAGQAEVQDDELEGLQLGTEGAGLTDSVAGPGDGMAGAIQRQAGPTSDLQRCGGAMLPDDEGAAGATAAPDAGVRADRADSVRPATEMASDGPNGPDAGGWCRFQSTPTTEMAGDVRATR